MQMEEFKEYFNTIELAQKEIGFEKKNKVHLVRLEDIKRLMIYALIHNMVPNDWEYGPQEQGWLDKVDEWVSNDESIKRVWLRDDVSKCNVPGRPWLSTKALWGENEPPKTGIVEGYSTPKLSSIGDSSNDSGDHRLSAS